MIGINPSHIGPGGCSGGGGPLPLPARGPIIGFPTFGPFGDAPAPFGGERFITSKAGGLILDKDGALAGRVPEGTVVDTKDGKLYGPDNKPITIPEGGKVDFLDLPDLADLLKMVNGGGPAGGEIPEADRFVPSAAGGIIIGKDGAPAGRIPAGSFIDLKDGKIYGPDSKVIEVPEGAKADFFDLPGIDELQAQARLNGGGTAEIPDADRFVPSQAGGVIIGKDGMVAGRIPAGSFIDLKDGKIYGPDSKAIAVPEGAKADFFDLPTLEELRTAVRGGGHGKHHETAVDGQWGPGGVTTFKGGATAPAGGCGMDHGPGTKAGGPLAFNAQALQQLQQMLSGRGTMPTGLAGSHPVWGAGAGSAVGGASGLGTIPSLESSLKDLVKTLEELARALAVRGGGVEQRTAAQIAADAARQTEQASTSSGATTSSGSSSSSSSSSS